MISIVKSSQLTQVQFNEVKALHSAVCEYDGYQTHFYWQSIAQRASGAFSDFLFYKDGQLAGFLAMYEFEPGSAEICAMVHPDHRHGHIFTRLFEEAQIEMRLSQLLYCDLICHPHSMFGKKAVKKLEATYIKTEFEMTVTGRIPVFKNTQGVTIRRATEKDIQALALLGQACFESDLEEELERWQSMIADKDRVAYLALVDDEPVGKAHALKRDGIFIHDFCVLPEHQGTGITRCFLAKVVNRFFQYGAERVSLHITSDHPKALQLYRNCGFTQQDSQEYWRYYFVPLPKRDEVLH